MTRLGLIALAWLLLVPALALLLLPACADTQSAGAAEKRDFPPFQRSVYPVLLRDCGFPACHGDHARTFRVFGPGRVRLAGETTTPGTLDDPTVNEQAVTYQLALSMIDPNDPGASLLLKKPLSVEAGGASHQGVDAYDRDVYRTTQDSGYVLLARWVLSQPMPKPASP